MKKEIVVILVRGDGASLLSSDMECVGCSAPLAPSGRLMVVGPPEPVKELRPWPPQLSKADKIRGHLLTATTSHSKIAELVGTSPQYVSNVARKMKNG